MSKFLAHCTPKKPKKEQGLPTTNLTYIPSKITKTSKSWKRLFGGEIKLYFTKKNGEDLESPNSAETLFGGSINSACGRIVNMEAGDSSQGQLQQKTYT